jgi:hypothetical protein
VSRRGPALPAGYRLELSQKLDQPVAGSVNVGGKRGDLALQCPGAILAGEALGVELTEVFHLHGGSILQAVQTYSIMPTKSHHFQVFSL